MPVSVFGFSCKTDELYSGYSGLWKNAMESDAVWIHLDPILDLVPGSSLQRRTGILPEQKKSNGLVHTETVIKRFTGDE